MLEKPQLLEPVLLGLVWFLPKLPAKMILAGVEILQQMFTATLNCMPTMGFVFFGFLSAFLVSLKGQFHEIVDPFYSNGFFIGIILTNKKLSRNF